MSIESDLEEELVRMGVPTGDFSVGSIKDGAICVLYETGHWIVITEDHGVRVFEKIFDNFNDLREFVLKMFSRKYYGGRQI